MMTDTPKFEQPGVYKFLNTEYIDDLLKDGSIKIGSLSYYRKLEAKEQWIADRLEGQVVLDAGGIEITEDSNKLDTILPPSLVGRVARAKSGGKIVFSPGVSITIQHPDVYIFSASKGHLGVLKQSMDQGTASSYDACVRILDIAHLAHRLFHRGKVPGLEGAKMSQLFQSFEVSDVAYDVLVRGQNLTQSPEASPFLKDVHFSGQKEIRIAFFPHQPIALETLIVQVPRPDQLFEEAFRRYADAERFESSADGAKSEPTSR